MNEDIVLKFSLSTVFKLQSAPLNNAKQKILVEGSFHCTYLRRNFPKCR